MTKKQDDATKLFDLISKTGGSFFANKDGIVVQIYGRSYAAENATEVLKLIVKGNK